MWPWRSTGRKAGPSVMPETSNHRAGNRVRTEGDADGAPSALLVRLRAPEANSQPVGPLSDIAYVEADQLAPA
jgi:hypothetical protein